MKILVTGGAGFIGTHLVQKLVRDQHEITILDNFSTSASRDSEDISGKVVLGDIRDFGLVEDLVIENEMVVHLAASLGVQRIMESALESMSVNIFGSECVLRAASLHKRRTLIASTSEVYGKNPRQPLSEGDDRVIGIPQNIRWSYSDAKAIEESMAHALFLENGFPVTTLRFFNTVGPGQTGRYGMVLPRFIDAARNGENLRIFGDGLQTRVFCHVDDAVRAIVATLFSDKSIGEVYNVGGEGEISIKDLAEKVIKISGSTSLIEYLDYKLAYPAGYEDMPRRVPNTEKIFNHFGWRAEKNIDEIISELVN